MYARVLGYMIIYAPSDVACATLCTEIFSCHGLDDWTDRLCQLGELSVYRYIRAFKKFKGRTPVPSEHSSYSSSDQIKIRVMAEIKEAPKNHQDAKAQALVRDGFRCVVTGLYDRAAVAAKVLAPKDVNNMGMIPIFTECAHIVPSSTYFDLSDTGTSFSHTVHYAASVLAVFKHFGYDVDKLTEEKVHSLYNVMTLEKNQHDWFDRLEMYFEATEEKNRYNITNFWSANLTKKVTLTSTNPQLPLPSPELLALHATCAKVAHFSGASEYIDELDRDKDALKVLSANGESADILAHALSGLMSRPLTVQ
ncbi:hypothetical protein F5I97DRAFT_1807702 [Phlebopus sp. FC_14]|nr:hypothetical protein F5I97DRAFT_1807702 [Phlebopus sp. FC_14]